MTDLNAMTAGRPLVLVGCGKMGGAMLTGWLAGGLHPASALVVEPTPSDALRTMGVSIAPAAEALAPAAPPRVMVIAVKPQMMETALPGLAQLIAPDTLILSIAAGTPIARFEAAFGADAPILRAMPNTPAAIGKGVSALIANARCGPSETTLGETLIRAVGEAVWLEREQQMDAVTAVSGSGPAYVFHLIEALAAAAEAAGLGPELAAKLARATVSGAGALADASEAPPSQLRIDVTSPGGVTAAALEPLMAPGTGLSALMTTAVAAGAARSRALGG